MDSIKFRLDLEKTGGDIEDDIEYFAIQDKNFPLRTLVSWYENGKLLEVQYNSCDVQENFEDGSWIII